MTLKPVQSKGLVSEASAVVEGASGYFKAPDGEELWFEDTGGAHPVLFYVYGLACSIAHWKYPRAHFSQPDRAPYRQVYLDFRGHGRSPRPGRGRRFTVRQLVEDIQALCEARGIAQATFLGQSMGGSIALELAAMRPDLVKGLVLLASPGRNPGLAFPMQPLSGLLWRAMIAANQRSPEAVGLVYGATLRLMSTRALRPVMREVIRYGGFNPRLARTEDIEEYVGKVLEVHPNVFYDMAAELSGFDVAKFTPPISCPTLIIAGGNDLVVPLAEQERLAGYLPRARLEVVPHGSHCPHFDDPRLVNELIEGFLREYGL